MNIIQLGFIRSDKNYSDICTKALNGPKLHGLSKELLFRTVDSGECESKSDHDRNEKQSRKESKHDQSENM